MARILFVVPRFHTNLFFATKALIEAGHEVAIFARDQGMIEDHAFLEPYVFGAAPDLGAVRDRLRSFDADLIFLRRSGALSKLVYRLTRRTRSRVLAYDLHPLTQQRTWRTRLSYWSQRRTWERVTPVPGLDAAATKDTAAHFLPWPVEAMPLPEDRYRPPEATPVHILCVGKLARARKKQDALIGALKPLADRIKLTLAGATDRNITGADEAHYRALIATAAQHEWINLVEDIDFAKMPALYAEHQICVLPAEREPLGVAPLEAMAYGTIPVIAEDAGSAGYISPGLNGERVDMKDAGALNRILRKLVDDRELRVSLSKGALQTARDTLSRDAFVRRVTAFLTR